MIIKEIVDLFAKELGRELTINQISKELKKSYASINGHVRGMITSGLLNSKDVGSAILCSPNYENPEIVGYLVLNSIQRTGKSTAKDIDERVTCAFTIGKTVYYHAIGDIHVKNWKKIDDLKSIVKEKLGDVRIIKGHEVFWRFIVEILK